MVEKRSLFKNYGVGVGLRPKHYPVFLNPETRPKVVDWVEVIAENFMGGELFHHPQPLKNLMRLRENYAIALHGVSLSLGSAHDLDAEYLKKWKALIDQVEPIVVSDHLCWTRVHGIQTHDLNPLPYTPTLVNHVARKIIQVQDFLKRRILIENVSSYLTFDSSQMSEAEFLIEVATQADCGLLLDINNVYVSARNHDFDPRALLSQLPHWRVGQIHLAGHTEINGFLIDTHDHPVRDEVWNLFRWYGEQYGHASAMIERDGKIPEWSELEKEIVKMKSLTISESVSTVDVPTPHSTVLKKSPLSPYEQTWQKSWADSLIGDFQMTGIKNQPPLSAESRFEFYENAFWIRLDEALSIDFPKLKGALGEEAWTEVLFASLSQFPPQSWTLNDLGENLIQWCRETNHPQLGQAELEWAGIKASALGEQGLPLGVNPCFEELGHLSENELNSVILVPHPSMQWVVPEKSLVWYDAAEKKQTFEEPEWRGVLALKEATPLSQLSIYEPYFLEWVRSGIICGWKKNAST